MQRKDIELKLIQCVADSLAIEAKGINTRSKLIDELDADSLDFMDIMFNIEEAFDIQMQREDLNFLSLIELSEERAVVDGLLTAEARELLKKWLPDLDTEQAIKPADLSHSLSIESLVIVVEIILANKNSA